jgi:hypothetical protein
MSLSLTSVAAGTGAYSGTITGGANNSLVGQIYLIAGFVNPQNNGVFRCTASTAILLTVANLNTIAETATATATVNVPSILLDPGGAPSVVVKPATATGTAKSVNFTILMRPDGGTRNLWLQMGLTAGTVTTATFNVSQSFDGGGTFAILQSGIDLVGSPSQQVSPPPSPGALLQVEVATISGAGATVSVLASSN